MHHQIPNADQSSDLYVKFEYLMLTRSINAYQEPLDFAHCGVRDAEFGLRKSALKSTFPPRLSPEMALSLRLSAEASAHGA